jgi:hypothetical protein
MKTKLKFINLFIVITLIAGLALGYLAIYYGAKDTPYDYDATHFSTQNNCPYEGYECPNAQAVILRDSLAYINFEQSVDSLINSNDSLRAQLAGCELQNHSKLTNR